jgi:putative transposase
MRQAGLVAKRRSRRVHTTDSNHSNPIAPNLLDRKFELFNEHGVRTW